MNDQAGQREVIAENLQANVLRELNILVKDFKEDRKKHLQEGARLMATLTGQISNLERARKAYEKAFREAERAVENYQRADADLNLSRAEVRDKLRLFRGEWLLLLREVLFPNDRLSSNVSINCNDK